MRILLLVIMLFALLVNMPQVEYIEPSGACLPTYPGGDGVWMLDGPDCWYLHTFIEFDTTDQCVGCHDGIAGVSTRTSVQHKFQTLAVWRW